MVAVNSKSGDAVTLFVVNRSLDNDITASIKLPGFTLHGMGAEAERYVTTTLERFNNPFLEHKLADIAQNHAVKIQNRIVAFIDWARRRDRNFAAPRLSAILAP